MLALVSLAISIGCAWLSCWRLVLVDRATALHPKALAESVRGRRRRAEPVVGALLTLDELSWEHQLAEGVSAEGEARLAGVNESLSELDFRLQRWSRVPRACASIASTAGFLLAALVVRRGLLLAEPGDAMRRAAEQIVAEGLGVVAMGLAGTAWCLIAHREAQRLVDERLVGVDRLVDRLERKIVASESEVPQHADA